MFYKAMKFIVIFVVFFYATTLYASPVHEQRATRIAQNWYAHLAPEHIGDYSIANVIPTIYNGQVTLYAINFAQGGFVIISADDATIPIIGYSYSSEIPRDITHPAVKAELERYSKEIDDAITNRLSNSETIGQWQDILNNRFSDYNRTRDVSPLLSTTWNQSTYYNQLCPNDTRGPDNHAYAGCVAASMAQVMKYHNYPAQGTGSHSYEDGINTDGDGEEIPNSDYGTQSVNFGATTYNWASMPDNLTGYDSDVATLLYHCGVSVNMNYGPQGSSASTSLMASSLEEYFGYASTAQYTQKSGYTDASWRSLLISELDASRPMPYRGSGSGGHAFICDGYQGTDYFHFNWGWGGYYDGYFYLDDLTPGSHAYTNSQAAIVGVTPAGSAPDFRVLSPNGGESWTENSNHAINWFASNQTTVEIEYTTNSGGSWTTITSSTSDDGAYAWTLPNVSAALQYCKVRVTSTTDNAVTDESDGFFTIENFTCTDPYESNDTPETAYTITPGDYDACIDPVNDEDWYAFTANAADTIILSSVAINGSELDDKAWLYGPSGSQVASDDDSNGSLHPKLTYIAQETGTYKARWAYYSNNPAAADRDDSEKENQLRSTNFGEYRLTLEVQQGPNQGFICADVTDIPENECEALIALYDSAGGDSWDTNTNWKSGTVCNDWHGVTVSGGHVTTLDLGSNSLSGSIPPEIGNLTSLTYLYLYSNELSGSIPTEIGNLTSLTSLNLLGNSLSGSIPPEIGNLTSLTYLNLYSNSLSGSIPPEIGNLTSLTSLYLSSNSLSGSIPPEIGNLTSLTWLVLPNNSLSGSIPPEIGNLTSLTYLYLGYNMLTASDTALLTFLSDKDSDWDQTQTVPPVNVSAAASARTTDVTVSWTVIPYTGDGGHYRILHSETSGGPYTSANGDTTADKSASSYEVTGLNDGTTYYFVVQTFTPAHGNQHNDLTSPISEEATFGSPPTPSSYDADISSGWNMLGLPLTVDDPSYGTLFPNAMANTFYGFSGSYQSATEFEDGIGYWLRFNSAETVTLTGVPVTSLTIDLDSGWNMISGPFCDVPLGSIQDTGDIIIANTLYEFSGSYQAATSVEKGKGYWIRARESGQIGLDCSSPTEAIFGQDAPNPVDQILSWAGMITFEDQAGQTQTLYLSEE
ncbi:MAG: hypothetical protein B6244_13670, partial [Candidatus Cloacimonetes bacterium 4572_55]